MGISKDKESGPNFSRRDFLRSLFTTAFFAALVSAAAAVVQASSESSSRKSPEVDPTQEEEEDVWHDVTLQEAPILSRAFSLGYIIPRDELRVFAGLSKEDLELRFAAIEEKGTPQKKESNLRERNFQGETLVAPMWRGDIHPVGSSFAVFQIQLEENQGSGLVWFNKLDGFNSFGPLADGTPFKEALRKHLLSILRLDIKHAGSFNFPFDQNFVDPFSSFQIFFGAAFTNFEEDMIGYCKMHPPKEDDSSKRQNDITQHTAPSIMQIRYHANHMYLGISDELNQVVRMSPKDMTPEQFFAYLLTLSPITSHEFGHGSEFAGWQREVCTDENGKLRHVTKVLGEIGASARELLQKIRSFQNLQLEENEIASLTVSSYVADAMALWKMVFGNSYDSSVSRDEEVGFLVPQPGTPVKFNFTFSTAFLALLETLDGINNPDVVADELLTRIINGYGLEDVTLTLTENKAETDVNPLLAHFARMYPFKKNLELANLQKILAEHLHMVMRFRRLYAAEEKKSPGMNPIIIEDRVFLSMDLLQKSIKRAMCIAYIIFETKHDAALDPCSSMRTIIDFEGITELQKVAGPIIQGQSVLLRAKDGSATWSAHGTKSIAFLFSDSSCTEYLGGLILPGQELLVIANETIDEADFLGTLNYAKTPIHTKKQYLSIVQANGSTSAATRANARSAEITARTAGAVRAIQSYAFASKNPRNL